MKRLFKPTKVQWIMIACMVVVYIGLIAFLIPEITGVLDPAKEDTLSEVIWDLPTWAYVSTGFLFMLTGIPFIWAGGHFIEGGRRREKWGWAKDEDDLEDQLDENSYPDQDTGDR